MTDSGSIWIKTEPSLDGKTFMVTLEVNEDRAQRLSHEGAIKYVLRLLTAIGYAEYDAAVMQQMVKLVDLEAALLVVRDLRKDRPAPLIQQGELDLTFEPGVSAQRKVGFLTIRLDGKPIGQWDLGPARRHALGVLEALVAADLDAAYLRELTGVIGLGESKARQAVEDISNYRKDEL